MLKHVEMYMQSCSSVSCTALSKSRVYVWLAASKVVAHQRQASIVRTLQESEPQAGS